ncbi:MAG: hypothetical protein JNM24_17810 [Bdellovibrionaceae bacterium]|nr:hypothetical protein [Pseudobdellovibrionaceae bacterium]
MKFILSLFLLATSFSAFAIVDMKNANYSNTWTDLELNSSGYDLKVVRTYNSRSLFSGMFGFGWCFEFETSLQVMPEGTIKIKECGSGTEILYAPREISQKDVNSSISQIITKMKADVKNPHASEYYKKLEDRLANEDDLRANLARQYGIVVQVKEGSKFYANGKEVENVILNKGHKWPQIIL